jgi:hypothetical protein
MPATPSPQPPVTSPAVTPSGSSATASSPEYEKLTQAQIDRAFNLAMVINEQNRRWMLKRNQEAKTNQNLPVEGQDGFFAPRLPSVDDLFGRVDDRGTPPRREGKPTIRGDQRQTTIPGTEGSAIQAQAQRDQAGSGRLQPKVDQKPADQGLFGRQETPWMPSVFIDMPTPAGSIEKLQDWLRLTQQSPHRGDREVEQAIREVQGYLRDRPKLDRRSKGASSSPRTA